MEKVVVILIMAILHFALLLSIPIGIYLWYFKYGGKKIFEKRDENEKDERKIA